MGHPFLIVNKEHFCKIVSEHNMLFGKSTFSFIRREGCCNRGLCCGLEPEEQCWSLDAGSGVGGCREAVWGAHILIAGLSCTGIHSF